LLANLSGCGASFLLTMQALTPFKRAAMPFPNAIVRRASRFLRSRCPLPLLAMLAAQLVPAFGPAGAEPLRVVVTSKPAHSLVAAVMEGVARADLLVDGTASPHTYAMRPSDAAKVNRATVFVRVSSALEPFTERLVRALPRSVAVLTLAEVEGITRLNRRTGGAFEPAADARRDVHSGHTHAGDADRIDPHIWLDPKNAKAMARAISTTLAAASPADAPRFAANTARLATSIDLMAAEVARDLAPAARRPFLVLHDAYQYFEHGFGLRAIGSILVDPDEQPSARRLAGLRRRVRGVDAVCVFAEPAHQPRIIASITEGTTARTAVLDPEGLSLAAGPGLYLELMRKLATSIRACLAPAA
jgi:zinc transport system substrate-binding protein